MLGLLLTARACEGGVRERSLLLSIILAFPLITIHAGSAGAQTARDPHALPPVTVEQRATGKRAVNPQPKSRSASAGQARSRALRQAAQQSPQPAPAAFERGTDP